MVRTVHRIVPQCSVLSCSNRHLGLDVVVGEVGDEVVMAVLVVASYQLQSILFSHQLRVGCLCHRLSVVALDNLGSLRLQLRDVLYHVAWHDVVAGNDQRLIACSGSSFYHAVLISTRAQVLVADVVAVESGLVDIEDALDKLGSLLRHAVNVEHHEPFLGIGAPHVSYGQIHQEVVVGLSPLQIGLTVGDVFHQFGRIAPDAVGGAHVDGGIEFPSRPWIVLWRIGCAVEEHVVDTGTEHQVHVGFHLTQRRAEVLGEPGESLA